MKAATIDGPVTVTGYENSFELTSVQFGESYPAGTTGGGSGTGKLTLTPITITKIIDGFSSAVLEQNLATGRRIASAEIHFINPSQSGPKTTYKIELKDVLLINHSVSVVPNCPNGCVGLTESFQLSYSSIRVTTYKQLQSGNLVVGSIYSWNTLTSSPTF